MGYKKKLVRNFSRIESQKIGLAVLATCLLVSMTLLAMAIPGYLSLHKLSLRLSLHPAVASVMAKETTNLQHFVEDAKKENAIEEMKPRCDGKHSRSDLCAENDVTRFHRNFPSKASDTSPGKDDNDETWKLGEDTSHRTMKPELPLCNFSDRRYDMCEMDGDIRIHGNSSNIIFVASPQKGNPRNESWRIRPYARKGDELALGRVRQVVVSSSDQGPSCTLNHSVPAIVFSVTGFTGNLFHDFTDVLVPLFLTAHQYKGEVQFLIADMKPWWIYKYRLFLKALSNYEIIDFNRDDRIHCFKHVIVGLYCHKELSIDPTRYPRGYTMVDFMRFMRSAYSLERERPTKIGVPGKKPRVLLIARKRTRTFLNVNEIVQMAEELGYEVVVDEAAVASDVSRFARIVNSCDVMIGVHGAGLTNFLFLPANASLIQIVPWGRLEWICKLDFGYPAVDAKLNYFQYSITKEESSLIEMYPKDHPMFKDPFSYHNRGWDLLKTTFMDKQNVRIDVRRLRAVLLEALEHLKQQDS